MGGSEPEPLLWPLVLQFILILINAVFSCTEIAVISMNGAKLELMSDAGNKRAKRLLSVSRLPSKFLAIMEVGMILAGFLGSAFAANNFSDRLMRLLTGIGMKLPEPVMNKISIVVITLILSYFTLVLGELVPKRIGMRNAEKIGLVMSGFVFVFAKIFTPAVWLLTVSTNGMLRLFRIDPNAEDEKVTEEEIRIMVDTGSDEGAIDVEEKEFIHNVFELDDITVDKIMTHRTEVTMLWLEESDEVWEETIIGSRHSIYPICEDDQDNIIGILNTKDYFRQKDRSRENIMKTAVKSPQ
ncbi:MAG: hemolysin family protein, partial [Defluviitaleaceae bacterium]|nr:hemolysin family protein [Defluviitaleaceae bacterium]